MDYTLVAIGVKDDEIDFSSNCGNMSNAVGPFAVDTGWYPDQIVGKLMSQSEI